VASWLGRGRPELAGKARRRSTWAQDLAVAHEHLVPGHAQANNDVWEVRQDVGSVGVGARGSGVVGVRRNRRFSPSVAAAMAGCARLLWWVSGLDQMERITAGEEEVRVRSLAGAITREFIDIEDKFIAGVLPFLACAIWGRRTC
jgi:hypothetical protein